MKVMYVMYVDWSWTKQRPQYLAGELEKRCDVVVLHARTWRRWLLARSAGRPGNLRAFLHIPFRYKSALVYYIDRVFCRAEFWVALRRVHPDVVWLTFPELYDYLPTRTTTPLVYDCMDDNLAFGTQKHVWHQLGVAEKRLCQKASIIFASSDHLAGVLRGRYGDHLPITIVRNAFGGKQLDVGIPVAGVTRTTATLAYVGTLAVVDRPLVLSLLQREQGLSFLAVGPIEPSYDASSGSRDAVGLWSYDRVTLLGPKPHEQLYDLIKNADCLVVPLRLSRLMESVDPLKIYEYINFGKPIVSVYYRELERYRAFVYFYNNLDELLDIMKDLMQRGFPAKYTTDQRKAFLEENTWERRSEQVMEALDGIQLETP